VLEQLFFTVTVEALPGNIPTSITVDVSHLALGDQLRVADLPIPSGVSVQHEPDELVVQVSIPRGLSEEEEAAEAALEAAAEGEEGAEGAAEDGASDGGDSEE
jgi:large subunit ribosomal protein L25